MIIYPAGRLTGMRICCRISFDDWVVESLRHGSGGRGRNPSRKRWNQSADRMSWGSESEPDSRRQIEIWAGISTDRHGRISMWWIGLIQWADSTTEEEEKGKEGGGKRTMTSSRETDDVMDKPFNWRRLVMLINPVVTCDWACVSKCETTAPTTSKRLIKTMKREVEGGGRGRS